MGHPEGNAERILGITSSALQMRKSILILLTVALGCVEQHAQQEGPSVTDSAGIEIVESLEPAWAPREQWHISVLPTPVVKAPHTETAAEFSRVLDVVHLVDGTR